MLQAWRILATGNQHTERPPMNKPPDFDGVPTFDDDVLF